MRIIAGMALVMVLMAAPVAAQRTPPDEARVAAAKEVIASSGGRADTFKYFGSMKTALVNQLRNQDPGKAEAAKQRLDAYLSEQNPKVAAALDEMEALAISFYASGFTTEELKTIAAFQGSAAGAKLRAAVPELSVAMAAPMFRFQHELMSELQKP